LSFRTVECQADNGLFTSILKICCQKNKNFKELEIYQSHQNEVAMAMTWKKSTKKNVLPLCEAILRESKTGRRSGKHETAGLLVFVSYFPGRRPVLPMCKAGIEPETSVV
jgi:hypothetical protein